MSEGRYMQVLSITDTLLGLPDVSGDVKGTALGYKALAYIMTNMLDSADIYITELEEILDKDSRTAAHKTKRFITTRSSGFL